MKIKWLGHSCFLITSEKGTRIITDPFKAGEGFTYKEVTLEADIVTCSHTHFDHNNSSSVKGTSVIIQDSIDKSIRDVRIRTISTYHDNKGGKERGPNLVFCFEIDGINVCHLGDLGHLLQKSQADALGKVDVLMVPVGGVFTIEPDQAVQICRSIKPAVAIPMHYKTEYCTWLKYTADDFARAYGNHKKLSTNEITLIAANLPQPTEIIIPKYQR